MPETAAGSGEMHTGVLSRQGHRRKAEKGFFGILFVPYKKDGKVPERFLLVCTKLRLRCADSRFAKPRSSTKGFNWIVRSRYLCALFRGLENLGASLKRF